MVRALLMTVVLVVGLSMVSVAEAGWRHRGCGGHHRVHHRGCASNYHGSYYGGGCYNQGYRGHGYRGCQSRYYGGHHSNYGSCGGGHTYHRSTGGCSNGVCY